MLNQNKRKISNLILFILIIVITGITCKNDSADKKKENLTLLSLLAYQQAMCFFRRQQRQVKA